MTIEKWKETLGFIKDNFNVEDEGESHFEDEGGVDVEFVTFTGPLGKMRLEFVTKPVVTGKKTTYSKRIGSESSVEYEYSSDEKSSKLVVYKWDDNDNDWVEVEANKFKI